MNSNIADKQKYWDNEKIVSSLCQNISYLMTYFAERIDTIKIVRLPEYTIINSGLYDDTFNYIINADFSEDQAKEIITKVMAYLKRDNIPFSWWISPIDNPINLQHLLEDYGFSTLINNPLMYINLDTWESPKDAPTELEIIQANDKNTLHDFANILTINESAFNTYFSRVASVLSDDDPIEHYVGYINGEPVVRGLICYSSELAGLHWLATDPKHRKKGYGTAMQVFRLKRAKSLGYHIAGVQASPQGYPLYKRLGYQECGRVRELKLILEPTEATEH